MSTSTSTSGFIGRHDNHTSNFLLGRARLVARSSRLPPRSRLCQLSRVISPPQRGPCRDGQYEHPLSCPMLPQVAIVICYGVPGYREAAWRVWLVGQSTQPHRCRSTSQVVPVSCTGTLERCAARHFRQHYLPPWRSPGLSLYSISYPVSYPLHYFAQWAHSCLTVDC